MTEVPDICEDCGHEAHEPGSCNVLFMYDRPGGLPGNIGCLCGIMLDTETTVKES